MINSRIFDNFADFTLILNYPLLEVLVLIFRIGREVAHNEFFLKLFIKPGVDHGLAPANINFSEVFEILD